MVENYLNNVHNQFKYYKRLGDRTFAQLKDEDLFWVSDEDANSIAILVNHLSGNMISRWTDFLTTDGEKSFRHRDAEFQETIKSREQLLSRWEKGWDCLFKAIESINESNFESSIYIRNQKHTITEAVNRQMMHYAYHIGQIVFIGRMLKGGNWESLSIPKGKSKEYNSDKFGKGKHGGYYGDDRQ